MSNTIKIEQADGTNILITPEKEYVWISVAPSNEVLCIEKENILPLCEMLLLTVKKHITIS